MRNLEAMTRDQKTALGIRGQICRPIGWSRDARRRVLLFRRRGRYGIGTSLAASIPRMGGFALRMRLTITNGEVYMRVASPRGKADDL